MSSSSLYECQEFCGEEDAQSTSTPIEESKGARHSQVTGWVKWRRPLIASIVSFLGNIENSMLSMGEWPYMTTIDPDTTATFYGDAMSVSKLTSVVFTFAFAFCAQKLSGVRIPMMVGRVITLVACVMYLAVEFIPSGRRWWMTGCYVLFSIGMSPNSLLRAYIARTTTAEDRSTGYSMMNGAMVLAIIIGPMAQIACAGLPYPGVSVIFPQIKLNIYTAPIWCAVVTNIVAIVLIAWLLDDVKREQNLADGDSAPLTLRSIIDRVIAIRKLDVPWLLAIFVILERAVSNFFTASMGVVAGPMITVMYALSGQQMILLLAVSQIIVGFLAVGLSAMYFFFNLGKRVSCRALFLISMLFVIAGYLMSYPFPFMSSSMQPYNETTNTGCDPTVYSWCDSQLVANIIPVIIAMIITMGFSIPANAMSLDTVYSKMLGDIDQASLYSQFFGWQSVMQSIIGVVSDSVNIFAPVMASSIFASLGLNYVQIVNGSIYAVATILWLGAWKWLRPYK